MPPQPLVGRVERLEERVTILEQLPGRVEALELQIVQLRNEIRAEFSATREQLREEIRDGDEETRRVLREEIRAGDDRILNQARMLHEELVSGLKLIEEGRSSRRKRSSHE